MTLASSDAALGTINNRNARARQLRGGATTISHKDHKSVGRPNLKTHYNADSILEQALFAENQDGQYGRAMSNSSQRLSPQLIVPNKLTQSHGITGVVNYKN